MSDAPSVGLVRVDQVIVHPHNIRQNLGDLRTLAESIRRYGVMQPVVVEKHAEMLRLRAGHRRVAAARLAGLKRVPAVIHENALDDDQWLIASVQEFLAACCSGVRTRSHPSTAWRVTPLIDLGCSRQGVADAVRRRSASFSPARMKHGRTRDRIYKRALRKHVVEWRERGVDLDTLLAELEALIADQEAAA